jgi:hypothetical protein
MARDFEGLFTQLADGDNRFAEMVSQVTASLTGFSERMSRLGETLASTDLPGRGPEPTGPGRPDLGLASGDDGTAPGRTPLDVGVPGQGLGATGLDRLFAGLSDGNAGAGLGETPPWVQNASPDPSSTRQDDRIAADNLRANQQSAQALEELVRNGVKLRDPPPAVYGE